MIAIQRYDNSQYELYYRHLDGYPTGLGVELIEALKEKLPIDKVIERVRAEDEHRTVEKPEDAYLKVQGDLEWIYVIRDLNSNTTSLEILKTSCPYFWQLALDDRRRKEFVFSVWFSYVRFFPEDYKERMGEVQRMAEISLNCLEAYITA